MYILTSPRLAGVVLTGTYLMCLCVSGVCMYVCARVYTCVRACMCVCLCICVHVCMGVCACVYACVCVCMVMRVGACVEQIHLSCLCGTTPELLHSASLWWLCQFTCLPAVAQSPSLFTPSTP